jgi:hypothetical protein
LSYYTKEKTTAIIKMRIMTFVKPPRSINPNVESNHKRNKIIAIVRKMPGSKLMRKTIKPKSKSVCTVNGCPRNVKRIALRILN